ncbi:MAG: hypothetical protein C4329_11715 [Chitinophagaceae bacterium]
MIVFIEQYFFAENENALKAIDRIASIHKGVETARESVIPDWAYRDVLFMLIHYSIASFESLERKLSGEEKEEVFNVFYRVGVRMGLKELPSSYQEWLPVGEQHLKAICPILILRKIFFCNTKNILALFAIMFWLKDKN